MKTKDIVVGRFYRHNKYTGVRYLGVGRAESYKEANKVLSSSKTLVILDGECAGRLVLKPRQVGEPVNMKRNIKFWDGFYSENHIDI